MHPPPNDVPRPKLQLFNGQDDPINHPRTLYAACSDYHGDEHLEVLSPEDRAIERSNYPPLPTPSPSRKSLSICPLLLTQYQ